MWLAQRRGAVRSRSLPADVAGDAFAPGPDSALSLLPLAARLELLTCMHVPGEPRPMPSTRVHVEEVPHAALGSAAGLAGVGLAGRNSCRAQAASL